MLALEARQVEEGEPAWCFGKKQTVALVALQVEGGKPALRVGVVGAPQVLQVQGGPALQFRLVRVLQVLQAHQVH